jgi:hypothetical protein
MIQIFEEFIGEGKKATRDEVMQFLKKKGISFMRTTEEFDGSKGGIWTSGEDADAMGGYRIFNYYATGPKYELGVLVKFEEQLNKLGWYSEWYDTGTMMLWPI